MLFALDAYILPAAHAIPATHSAIATHLAQKKVPTKAGLQKGEGTCQRRTTVQRVGGCVALLDKVAEAVLHLLGIPRSFMIVPALQNRLKASPSIADNRRLLADFARTFNMAHLANSSVATSSECHRTANASALNRRSLRVSIFVVYRKDSEILSVGKQNDFLICYEKWANFFKNCPIFVR